jgi:hypothetical protein
MALTEAQKLIISKILRITPTILNLQIDALEISAELETAIEEQIDLWQDGAGAKFARVHPNVKNFGAEVNPDDLKSDIRNNIANYLERPDWSGASSSVEFSLSR